jgi:hypothetical protein
MPVFPLACCTDTSLCFYRPQTVFELVAQLWNDSSFNPTAPVSDCHSNYQSAVDCSYEVVAGLVPVTPQKIEDVFTSMRSDLLRIISRWEQSGHGEGGWITNRTKDKVGMTRQWHPPHP